MRTCTACKLSLPDDCFYARNAKCKTCFSEVVKDWRRRNPEKVRHYRRKWDTENPEGKRRSRILSRYNLTLEDFDDLLAHQGDTCAICESPEPGGQGSWHVDHDHSCCPKPMSSCGKCVRGLLCQKCNMAIGLLGDSAERVTRAAQYLKKAELG